MQTLHIVTPSHSTTPIACFGLMRVAQQHCSGSHHVIVIGNQVDARDLQTMGMSVLGHVDGYIDTSRTLARRIQDVVRQVAIADEPCRIIAWGWHPATIASAIEVNCNTLAIVDEIDYSCSLAAGEITIIPTSWTCATYLRNAGVPEGSLAEPLVGVNPTTLVMDRATVKELLHLQHSELVIGIVGKLSSWYEIVSMAVRLQAANVQADFVLFHCYEFRSQLILAAKQHGVVHMFHDTPNMLRVHDVIRIVDGVWVPSVASHVTSYSVLDVILVAWEGVPLAVRTNHAVAGVPTVGQHIAWARDELEVSGWLLDLAKGDRTGMQQSSDLTTRIRSIASPARFVEGLQLRM